jgi:hypothetical protein
MHRRRILFRLKWKDGERRHNVEHWQDYGVVCPDLVTTNGSVRFLADFVWSHVQAGRYEIEAEYGIGEPDMRSEIALRDWMVAAVSKDAAEGRRL